MLGESAHRAIGHDVRANNYPLSPAARRMQAEMLNVREDQVPAAARYAANAYMQAWYDLLGAARDAGKPYRISEIDGFRYLGPKALL